MKPLWELPRAIRAELDRLHQEELTAWSKRDLTTATTCRLLWCELYLQSSGMVSPALPNLTHAAHPTPVGPVDARPPWLREMRARPLVAVVERRAQQYAGLHGQKVTTYIEILACGHERAAWDFWPDQKPAKRRRCHECGRIRLSQHDTKRAEVIEWPVRGRTTVSGAGSA